MFSLIEFVFPLIFITAAHGLAPPSPSPATILPFSSLSSTLQLLNLSSTDDDGQPANATNDMVKCDGRQWGYDLDKASCEETWKKIPTDSHFFTYGARSRGVFDRPLPYRYLSGECSASKFDVIFLTCCSSLRFRRRSLRCRYLSHESSLPRHCYQP